MSRALSGRSAILFSTADWAAPYWTNKQHVASRLAQRGWKILYVETVGLRRPRANRLDFERIARRLRGAAAPPRQVAERLWVASPLALPIGHRGWPVRTLNDLLLRRSLRQWQAKLQLDRPVLWTYHPYMLEAAAGLRRSALVYHCVDEIAAIPGVDAAAFAAAERRLLAAADLVFASSRTLHEKCAGLARTALYLPNAADIAHFAAARAAGPLPPELARIPRPRLGFVGVLSDFKVDLELLERLAAARPDWHLVLIGDEREGQSSAALARLQRNGNVHWLGHRPYAVLPRYLAGLEVGLLPMRANAYTRAVFPMKFFEYLAAGLPVVASAAPALAELTANYRAAESAEGFVAAVGEAIERGPAERLAIDDPLLRRHDWTAQIDRMVEAIDRL